MEFNPNNNIARLCIQGMNLEEKGELEGAGNLFLLAWNKATNELEKFIAAYYVARIKTNVPEKLQWLETTL